MQKIAYYFITLFFCFFGVAYGDELPVNGNRTIKLSLDEAILLAVRENPNFQSIQLNHVLQKFNVFIQEWHFHPQFAFQASVSTSRNVTVGQPITANNYNVQPTITLNTPIGTNITLASTNPSADHFNPTLSLQIMQPLLRGFGTAVVESSLNNARDSEVISRLSIEGSLRSMVSSVINAYLDVISAQQRIVISEDAVKRAEISVKQTRLFIKAGRKAGNELVTVEANVASAKTTLENDRNNLDQARYGLLAAIGIDPNTKVSFEGINIDSLIKKYHLPALDRTKRLILENDIQYQIDQITLHGQTTRNLLVAEDNARWQLNLNATAATGGGSGGGQNAGFNSLVNGINSTSSAGLALQIPIDDQLSKQAIMSAKIALKQAELVLLQERWTKETSAINAWNLVLSAERALQFAEDAEKLQKKTYNVSYQKYIHGLIDSLELQSAQLSLTQSQQTLSNNQINYIKALVNMDLLIGHTLKTWNVQVRL